MSKKRFKSSSSSFTSNKNKSRSQDGTEELEQKMTKVWDIRTEYEKILLEYNQFIREEPKKIQNYLLANHPLDEEQEKIYNDMYKNYTSELIRKYKEVERKRREGEGKIRKIIGDPKFELRSMI